jgi:hypothetical protein
MTTSVSSGGMILTGESRVPRDKVALVTCNVTLARWCNHCRHKEASVRSVYCWATCHCQRYKISIVAQKWFHGQFVSPAVKGTHVLSLHVKCPIFCVLSSSSSCSGRIRFDSCSLYPQNEIGPSISSSVVLCVWTKFGVCRQISVTVPSMKIVCSPSSGSRADTCRQTDGQTDCWDGEANRSFSRMCERDYKARALKTKIWIKFDNAVRTAQ